MAAVVAAQAHVPVATVPPRPDDVATIDGMVKAYYEVVSGPAGQPRDWARDRTLYIKGLRFVQVDVDKTGNLAPRITDHQQYVDSADGLTKEGFFEKEIHRVTERFGPIAHVWSTYESRRTETGPIIMRGINSIELFWDGKRWWIANAIWTDETKENPIPKEYLPSAR
ncbi:MAG TPA: nuclear transport factor 2 family protein [Thermoanaerobaculia bacterium]